MVQWYIIFKNFLNDFNVGTIYLQIKVEPKSATINAPLVSFGEGPLKAKQTDRQFMAGSLYMRISRNSLQKI